MERKYSAHDIFVFNITRLLDDKRMSQAELAKRMRCSAPYVSQILSQRKDPGLLVVDRVARSFDVPVADLFQLSEDDEKKLMLLIDAT